jgi:hypothetical protein
MAYRETQIDENFPVAGVDNESQGFRDNFSAIKDTLVQAKADVLALQESRLDISSPSTDLSGNTIENVNLKSETYEFNDGSGISSSQNVSYASGSFHLLALSGGTELAPVELVLSDIPTSGVARFQIAVHSDGTENFFSFNTENTGRFFVDGSWPTLSVTAAADDFKLFELWTYDGGNNVFARYLGTFSAL